ncbi:HipA N-terminal domain-containing protein [Peredibacter sp. HCB2-198]|uniref:HipA N-terminal domain-containing protein n=1 Tax=Peredibacter sp. HCB2-198 TaxID=3383025 RepID=UPI0038B4B1A9
MNRRGKVFVEDEFAGVIEQKEGLFVFKYDAEYLKKSDSLPVSLTLPLRTEAYEQKTMFPFFDGLIPEGWLLNIIEGNWKINPRDRMSLLLLACRDSVGNVSVVDDSPKDEK